MQSCLPSGNRALVGAEYLRKFADRQSCGSASAPNPITEAYALLAPVVTEERDRAGEVLQGRTAAIYLPVAVGGQGGADFGGRLPLL